MTTYVGFFLLTVILVSIDIYQTRGGSVTIKKAAIWATQFVLAFLFMRFLFYLFWDIYAPNSDYRAKSNRVCSLQLFVRKIIERRQLFALMIFAQYQVPEHLDRVPSLE